MCVCVCVCVCVYNFPNTLNLGETNLELQHLSYASMRHPEDMRTFCVMV